jgi:hypothetical protein
MAYGDCPHGRKGTPIIGNYVSCPAECTTKAQEYYLGNGTWTMDPVDLSKIKKAPKQMVNAWASNGYLAPSPVHSPSQPSGVVYGKVDRAVGPANIIWLTSIVPVQTGMDVHHPGLGLLGVVKSGCVLGVRTIFDIVKPNMQQLHQMNAGDDLRFEP